MLSLLEVLAGVLDLADVVLVIAKCWRLVISLIACGALIALLCRITDSTPLRWIAGFPVFATCLTAGVYWESRRGALRDR